MIVLAVIGALIPALTILLAVGWGWRNGTLVESAQDRVDWDFERIVDRF
ncbi:MAG: hypothetical protein OER12_01320 [Acidimicrobiia bacterium]|nr:hypothetical protein [Acidimicrobiia bacterium]